MEKEYIKLANIKMDFKEVKKEFEKGNIFIFKYKTIYQIHYSNAQKTFYSSRIMCEEPQGVGFTKKGRHILTNAEFGNKLLGYDLLVQ